MSAFPPPVIKKRHPITRLLAFVLVMDGRTVTDAAEAVGVTRQAADRWAQRLGTVLDTGDPEYDEMSWLEYRELIRGHRILAATDTGETRRKLRSVHELALDVDGLLDRVIENVEAQIETGQLDAKVGNVAELGRLRMQVEEFKQRERMMYANLQVRMAAIIKREVRDQAVLERIRDAFELEEARLIEEWEEAVDPELALIAHNPND